MYSIFNIILFWLPGLGNIQNKSLLLKSQMAYTQYVKFPKVYLAGK
jgi:hypothetical protein